MLSSHANLASAVLTGILPPRTHLTADGYLEIGKCELLVAGSSRAVYAHPSAPDLLVKVMLPDQEDAAHPGMTGTGVRRRRGRFGPYDAFYRETKETIHATRAVHPNHSFAFPFARSYGFIWTTGGLGQVVERIGSADGSLAPTLSRLLEEGRFTSEHTSLLEAFFDLSEANGLVIGPVQTHNIVYQDTARRFVCIGGFGEKHAIPIHELSRFANRLEVRRTRRRLFRTIRRLSAARPLPAGH